MKKKAFTLCNALSLSILLCFVQCKKKQAPLNISLHDKPLSVIKSYISGKWRLRYKDGGFVPMRYPLNGNSYLVLGPERIVFGDEMTGVSLDAAIVWKRGKAIYYNDSTYLLTFSDPTINPNIPYSYYVVEGIYNDSLVLGDDSYDGYGYIYSK